MPNSINRWRGSTALVTGAAKRLGRAVALALGAEGLNVVVHYRSSRAEAEEVCDRIRAGGGKAWVLRADLDEADAPARLFEDACDRCGTVDVLVNSASIFPADTLGELQESELQRNMRVNAWAPLALGRALAAQGREGAIVNFLDTKVVHYDAAHVSYHLSKRAFFALTRMMALEFAPRVTVNAVAPGLVLPPPGEDEAYLERLARSNPLQRYGTVAGITDAVLYLLSSDFVTGQVIYVDGGYHMKGRLYE